MAAAYRNTGRTISATTTASTIWITRGHSNVGEPGVH
jgi:hypothetical protein